MFFFCEQSNNLLEGAAEDDVLAVNGLSAEKVLELLAVLLGVGVELDEVVLLVLSSGLIKKSEALILTTEDPGTLGVEVAISLLEEVHDSETVLLDSLGTVDETNELVISNVVLVPVLGVLVVDGIERPALLVEVGPEALSTGEELGVVGASHGPDALNIIDLHGGLGELINGVDDLLSLLGLVLLSGEGLGSLNVGVLGGELDLADDSSNVGLVDDGEEEAGEGGEHLLNDGAEEGGEGGDEGDGDEDIRDSEGVTSSEGVVDVVVVDDLEEINDLLHSDDLVTVSTTLEEVEVSLEVNEGSLHPLRDDSSLSDVSTVEVEVLAKGADVLEHGSTVVDSSTTSNHVGELAERSLSLGRSSSDILGGNLGRGHGDVSILGSNLDSLDDVETVGLVSEEFLKMTKMTYRLSSFNSR